MVNRNRNEIFASILRSAAKENNGTRFTKLMYDSFLSYTQINEYLKDLIRFDLLIYEPEDKRYRVTQKGLRCLVLIDKLNEILKVER